MITTFLLDDAAGIFGSRTGISDVEGERHIQIESVMRVRCRLVGTGNNIFIDISDRGADPDLTATGATITIGVPDANGVAILSPRADEQDWCRR